MSALFRFGRRGAGAAAAAAAGLAAVNQFDRRQRHLMCADGLKETSQTMKSMQNTLLFKAFTRRYGAKKSAQLMECDVAELLNDIGIKNEYMQSRIFRCIDADSGGSVDYKEIMSFCRMLGNGGGQDRLKFMFKACDINDNGKIDMYEFRKFLKNLYLNCNESIEGFSIAKSEEDIAMCKDLPLKDTAAVMANRMAYEIFRIADADKSGTIELKEFIFWYTRGGKVVKEFSTLFPFFDQLVKE